MTKTVVQQRIVTKYNDVAVRNLCEELNIKQNWCRGTKRGKYLNLPVSFDIETTSITNGDVKSAYMYIWMICIDGRTFYGRTWGEWLECLQIIHDSFDLTGKRKIVVYVHNLSFEFQFIRKHLTWLSVFANEERKPIYALCDLNIEFRCSYFLSNYSLAKVADNLTQFEIKKLVGDLDYRKIRTRETTLTNDELDYCINDVLILCCYIQEKINDGEPISKIPLTNTGYVRRYCRSMCLDYGRGNGWYDKYIHTLNMSKDLYILAKKCFMGGFTHSNNFNTGKTRYDVESRDFISAYPAQMCGSREFVCETPHFVKVHNEKQLNEYINHYACFFTIEFVGLREKDGMRFEHYIPSSKCSNVLNYRTDNGRIVFADLLTISITNIDYEIIRDFYTWKDYHIIEFYIAEKSYLPKPLIRAILDLYKTKSELKDVPNKESELMHAKGMLNATFGMMVTDIIRDVHSYDTEWTTTVQDVDKQIELYNESRNRFSYYIWGVQITALCRRELFKAIKELKYDYLYADTDSVKFLNGEQHNAWFDEYNKQNREKMLAMCEHFSFDKSMVEPENIHGVKKMLGEFERETPYEKFKTLGAKRYMTMKKGELSITVSGLNKKVTVPYLKELANEKGIDPFDLFNDELYIPKGKTGKLTHTYIDEKCENDIIDYEGHTTHCVELSCVHLDECDYTLSMTEQYIKFIKERQHDYEILQFE